MARSKRLTQTANALSSPSTGKCALTPFQHCVLRGNRAWRGLQSFSEEFAMNEDGLGEMMLNNDAAEIAARTTIFLIETHFALPLNSFYPVQIFSPSAEIPFGHIRTQANPIPRCLPKSLLPDLHLPSYCLCRSSTRQAG